MDNLARVVAVAVANNQITPCVKVLRGADVAARQQGTSYAIKLTFTYTSGGEHVGPIEVLQSVARLTFVQPLDAYFNRCRGLVVDLPSRPDANTPVVCTATLQITTAERSQQLDCGPADTSTFYPTIG